MPCAQTPDSPVSALAHTAIQRGIVESISARQVGRHLARVQFKFV